MSEIHSVIFPKESFNVGQSREWLKKNKLIWNGKVNKEYRINYLTFRQKPPELFKSFSSKKLPNGIIIIIGYK